VQECMFFVFSVLILIRGWAITVWKLANCSATAKGSLITMIVGYT
jgi:hypothetical protein